MSNKNKNWIGNDKSIFVGLGASNHSKGEREKNDYYATDPIAGKMLLELEEFNRVLEPSCGEGHLSKVFEDAGIEVHSSDLIERNYGEVKDFFSYKSWEGDIITNPPYKYAKEFIEHSLNIIPKGNKVAMFLKVLFLESQSRASLFANKQLKTVYISSKRISCYKNGDLKNKANAVAYAWYVWEKGYEGNPILKWFN